MEASRPIELYFHDSPAVIMGIAKARGVMGFIKVKPGRGIRGAPKWYVTLFCSHEQRREIKREFVKARSIL